MVTMTKHVDEPEEIVVEEPVVEESQTVEEPVTEETSVPPEPEPEKEETVPEDSEEASEIPVESEKDRQKREKKERKEREKAEKEEAKEREKAEKAARKEKGKSKKKGDDNSPILERRDTVIKRSDSVAHRNVRYKPRGRISQTFTATRVELKRLKKTISPWILVLWAVAILVSANVDVIAKGLDIYDARQGLDILRYMGKFLFLLPIIAVFYCAKASGTVPVLFRDKIAYLHFALPVSKGTFYMGKFFAYLLLTVAMLTVFYGCSFASAQLYYPYEGFEKTILVSYGLACLASFALLAMIMCFSIKRIIPSTLRAIVILLGAYPLVYGVLHLIYDKLAADSGMLSILEGAMDAVGYLPMCGYDFALEYIGATGFYSGKTLSESFTHAPELLGLDWKIAAAVYFVWGLIFLSIGLARFRKREL